MVSVSECSYSATCRRPAEPGYKGCAQCRARCSANAAKRYAGRRDELNHQRTCSNRGITPAIYAEMLEAQGGVCAICKRACQHYKRLAVDHDHNCCPGIDKNCGNCVRGLLCNNCNRALGMFGESTEKLHAAIDYLRAYQGGAF